MKKKSWRFPISFKLIGSTLVLLSLAALILASRSSDLFETMSGKREEDANRAQAQSHANEMEEIIVSYMDKIKVVGSLLLKPYSDQREKDEALNLSFHNDRDLLRVDVLKMTQTHPTVLHSVTNQDFFKENPVPEAVLNSKKVLLEGVFAGKVEIRNTSLPPANEEDNGVPLLTIALPIVTDDLDQVTHIARAIVRLDRIQKIFSTVSERVIYLVDDKGELLAHPDDKKTIRATNMSQSEIVQMARREKLNKGQKRFQSIENNNEYYIGAFAKTSSGLTVVAQAPEAIILEPARLVKRESFRLAGFILSGALFLIFFLSITITTPIERLLSLTGEIAKGNFEVNATQSVRSRDEVGELASAFDEMTAGLRERDKVKNMFNKFHGSSIAEEMLSGEVSLGGSAKDVTVFFSDIRDFTKFSETRSPEEVVEMLNEYFAIMVRIINEHQGVVDKFVGDAIMAVWGAPQSTGEDELLAVRACIEMRKSLEELNKQRIERDQVPIKIGMGLHSGRVVSGTIGSDERMEYTVIGDTVNMAARIEASTKAFGADLLVSEVTAAKVEGKIISEYAGAAEVKGKSEALKLFKIRGYVDEDGSEVIVRTEYSDYEAASADKVKIAS